MPEPNFYGRNKEENIEEINIQIKFDPVIRNEIYRIVDSSNRLVDTLEGEQIKEEYQIDQWKQFFEMVKDHLRPKENYLVIKTKLGETKGTPVFSYAKSLMLSGLSQINRSGNTQQTGLNDMLYSQLNDTNLAGIETLQTEIQHKNTLLGNLQTQIATNYETLLTDREKFDSERQTYLKSIKDLEIRIKELEQENKLLIFKQEMKDDFNKKLEKASSGDIDKYLPLIQMGMSAFQGGSPPPMMSAPPPMQQQQQARKPIQVEPAEVDYL